ncbi:MAG: AMP-binding protein [Oscillospiraceae bacterium]|nr:AMP-binding protein [Oscillospiraceae bacterium]
MSIASSAPWLAFYGDTPAHLDYPRKTIYQMIRAAGLKYPKYYAYEFMGKTVTYAEFLARIDLAAKSLLAAGIRKGDRVTICMPNCPQALDTFYALNRIGAVSNMIHPLSAASEIEFYLEFSKSKAILTLDQFYPKISSIRKKLSRDVLPIVTSIKDELPPQLALGFALTKGRMIPKLPKDEGILTWSSFLAGGRRYRDALPEDDGVYTDCASILYSGGTTGTTKGILLSNLNFNVLGLQTIAASGFAPIHGMKMLSVMPVFHGFGLGIGIHTALMGGACCILVPQFNVKTYAKLLVQKKPNIIPGVPTLFEALLRTENLEHADLSFLKGVFCGGDSLSIELKKKVDDFLIERHSDVQIRQGYGLTECVTASCLTPKDYHRVGSIGVPFPDTYYKIVKVGTEDEVEPGVEGEICISGPSVMIGYLDNPDETAQTLRRHVDGRIWLHTGDLGKMDADGFVYFSQRIKRMIVTSGYNVYPGQLENIIDGHEKVLISCVIGVKDPYKMQKVKAFIVLRPGVEPTEETKQELLAYCRKHIAKYAVPYDIEFRTELPKTLVGKVAYRALEEEEAGKQT